MTKTLLLSTAMMLASSAALADENATVATPEPQASPEQTEATVAPMPSAPAAVVPMPSPAPMVATAASASAPCDIGPEPYTGWSRGRRAPMYVNLMLTAGAYGEDGSNRLTTRDSKVLEGAGAIFRIGAVLSPNHRLGGRIQSFFRPTKKILLDANSAPATDTNKWGGVSFVYAGPEYIYDTGFGLYASGSIGVAGAMSKRDLEDDDDNHDDIERGSAGAAGMVSVGYEWRASKWFAMNAEVYGGLYHGIDDNETTMNGSTFGLAMGVGF
jgi:hypothetical protein